MCVALILVRMDEDLLTFYIYLLGLFDEFNFTDQFYLTGHCHCVNTILKSIQNRTLFDTSSLALLLITCLILMVKKI
jgi:hypothetical protein